MSQSNSRLSTLLLPLLALALPPLSGCDVLAQLQDQFGPLAPDDAPVEPTEPAPSPSDPAPLVCESLGHTDEVVLSSQAEAEAFAAEFTSARVITIQGQELLDLDALDCLERVNALTANDTALERVDLPSLSFVGNFDSKRMQNCSTSRCLRSKKCGASSLLAIRSCPP